MSSIIMRQTAVAERANGSEQCDHAGTSEQVPFSRPQRSAYTWLDTVTSVPEAGRLRQRLRHGLDALASVVMLGGVFVVPVATFVALICLWLPGSHMLHRTAPTFFAIASVWFLTALLLSHFQPRYAPDVESGPA